MLQFDPVHHQLLGPAGQLPVPPTDEVTRKLAMLIEGECHDSGPLQAARTFGFSKQRYFQLRQAYRQGGAAALASQPRGPKRPYRRTNEVVRQVIRHRFLDPEASAAVIAQKLTQAGWTISIRSVERVIEHFGLQKKTPSLPSQRGGPGPGNATHHDAL
jgi:transposase